MLELELCVNYSAYAIRPILKNTFIACLLVYLIFDLICFLLAISILIVE